MSEAPDIDRIELSEVRQLREAQRGDARALARLLEPHLAGIWSICRHHLGAEDAATEEVLAFRDTVASELRRLKVEDPFGLQLYRLLWQHLVAGMEPKAPRRIDLPDVDAVLMPATGPSEAMIRSELARTPPLPRLIYLFWLVTGLPAPRLAQITGQTEPFIRTARAAVALRLHVAGR